MDESLEIPAIISVSVSITHPIYSALIDGIDTLEQEPILDKIRAEIEPIRKMYLDMNDIDWLNGCDYVLSVIDKYKAESERMNES